MLTTYFKIIRTALLSNRKKGQDVYYESHHIIPQSFNKKSAEVLLTAREHYRVHKILAEQFKSHPVYGQKMLWAFHRMAYDGKRKLTEQEYSEARELLMPLWKREKKEDWKKEMSKKMKGNKNGINCKANWIPTEEQRKNISEAATRSKLGKVGAESRASKGSVIYETEDGKIVEAGSAHLLSKIVGIKTSTMIYRMKQKPGIMINGYKVYYK
jgi:hypothetical protein